MNHNILHEIEWSTSMMSIDKKMPAPIHMIGKSIRNREMIVKLAKNDFRTKYAGSYFGIAWAFV